MPYQLKKGKQVGRFQAYKSKEAHKSEGTKAHSVWIYQPIQVGDDDEQYSAAEMAKMMKLPEEAVTYDFAE